MRSRTFRIFFAKPFERYRFSNPIPIIAIAHICGLLELSVKKNSLYARRNERSITVSLCAEEITISISDSFVSSLKADQRFIDSAFDFLYEIIPPL